MHMDNYIVKFLTIQFHFLMSHTIYLYFFDRSVLIVVFVTKTNTVSTVSCRCMLWFLRVNFL